jgi:putative DNA primase/helicase
MGWKVFPVQGIGAGGQCDCGAKCATPGKHPILANGHNGASSLPGAVRLWWNEHPNANIGIKTGKDSNLIVLDVDGQEGLASLKALGLSETGTLSVRTGSGGLHLYYQWPGHPVRNSAGKLGKGLDIRGDGGYTIGPPSRHVSGQLYKWQADLDHFAIAPLPETLAKLITTSTRRAVNAKTETKVKSGGRNVYLTSVAGTLWNRLTNQETLRQALYVVNQRECDPPLSDREVDTIAASISKKPTGNPLAAFGQTEFDYARRMALFHSGEIHYVKSMKRWLIWTGSYWLYDDTSNVAMKARTKDMLSATLHAAGTLTDSSPEEQARKRSDFRDAVKRRETKRTVDALIDLTASEPEISITPDALDTSPWLFNVKNGTLDLARGTLQPHAPAQLITKVSPVVFDEKATAPQWERFISQIFNGDDELSAYVQRVLGYMLTGDTREQQFWIAIGGGANGKSTVMRTMLRVLGEGDSGYGATTQFSTFDADNRNEYGNDLAALKGKRAVFAIETERERNLAEARVKSITGGDAISCRFLYGEYFSFRPEFKCWLVVNHTPNVRNQDRGIWRRLKWVPFSVNFEETEDKELSVKLSEELPGILNWLLTGLRQWQTIGMAEPDSVKQATEDVRRDSDIFGQWLEERTTKAEGAKTAATDLYWDYRAWSEERGELKYVLGHKYFGISLAERGYTRKHTMQGNVWLGIALVSPGTMQRTRLDRTMGG